MLSRYVDVLAALHEPALWPVPPRRKANKKVPDERAREALRAQVAEAFSSRRLNEWQVRLGFIPLAPSGDPVDLVAEFAAPWCLAAAEIVTGADAADRDSLVENARVISDSAMEPMDEALRVRATAANATLDRCLLNSPVPLPGPTFVALSRTLACILANGWLALLRQPAVLERLRESSDQIPKAVEEILRVACIPQVVFRCASRAVRVGGLELAEGDRLALRLASANRDPEQFPDPDRIDLARRGPAHLALGFGPHSCIGAALIRMAATVATRVFVGNFGGSELCSPEITEWRGGDGFRSPAALRVRPAISRG